MKKLALLTLIAAFVFGVQPQNATAAEITDGPSLALPTGNAKIELNAESILNVLVETAGDRERVTISILNSHQQVVLEKVLIADGRGEMVELDLKALKEGGYYVKVSSNTIDATEKIRIR